MEKCIMPLNDYYSTTRLDGLERHEVFNASNRNKSIKYGLVVFLTPDNHRGRKGVHGSPLKWEWLKQLGQKTWQEYYNKTKEDFIKEFGRSYE